MKLTSKILVDRLVGVPVVAVLNTISRILLHLKHASPPDNSTVRRIAVCKFMGMGSIIESTPLLMTLRANYPDAEIVFLTLPKNYALCATFPFVDEIVCVDDSTFPALISTTVHALIRLWHTVDVFIDLEVHSSFSTLLAVLMLPTLKIGYYIAETDIRLGVYTTMIRYNTDAPVQNIYLQAAGALRCTVQTDDLYNWHDLPKRMQLPMSVRPPGGGFGTGYIVVNPNASDLRIERRWGQAKFTQLIVDLLRQYSGMTVVLTGAADEQTYVNEIMSGIPADIRRRVIDSSGMLSVTDLIALIDGCTVMITNDSGPMHIAFGLKKHVIALFGPCSPRDYRMNEFAYFIYTNLYCSPCVHHFVVSPCRGDNQCMKRIGTEDVMAAVAEVIQGGPGWKRGADRNGIHYAIDGVPFGIVERT